MPNAGSSWPALRAAHARVREAEAALTEDLPRARVAEALASARATAQLLGARPLLEQIERLSRPARIRTTDDERAPARDEIAGLTARELNVLRLVAEGRQPQNRQGALHEPQDRQRSRIRILSKLDARTRTEAAGVAHRLGLLDTKQRHAAT